MAAIYDEEFHMISTLYFIFYQLFNIVDWTGISNRKVKERYVVNLLTCNNRETVYHKQRNPHCSFIFCPLLEESLKVSKYCQSIRVFLKPLRIMQLTNRIVYWLISLPWWQVAFFFKYTFVKHRVHNDLGRVL